MARTNHFQRGRRWSALCLCTALLACEQRDEGPKPSPVRPPHSVAINPAPPRPQILFLPDGGDIAPPRAPGQDLLPGPWGVRSTRCPPEMVDVRGEFCIDRFEGSLVDVTGGRPISPYYHPRRAQTQREYARWQRARLNSATELGRALPLPSPPEWQLSENFEPKVVVKQGAIPNGYMSGLLAEQACKNAGKRLCRPAEWLRACRGESGKQFPYGDSYQPNSCNVFREAHPASVLHDNPSINHLDPRLNLVKSGGKPLLRPTGTTPDCQSRWGDDAIYDMVGNLDEWVDDPDGLFLGGFFSRNSKAGCDAKVSAHPRDYYDYSLGVRCCK